jgi:hypothetical protein
MAWFEGELVVYLVNTLSYLHRIAFHSYLPNLLLLHLLYCLYLLDYTCHYARMTRDEI